VGKVEAIAISGLEMWFWSDDHPVPHFHVKKAGEWEIRVNILETQERQLSYELKWGRGPNGKLQGTLASLVAKNKDALYKEWSDKTGAEG
jgi:hypothetical protein